MPVVGPATDIRETNEAIVLTADMPGVKCEGVEITLDNGVLTVHGTVARQYDREGDAVYAEYDVGNYQRSFSVPDAIDHDAIEARMNNGVLTLTLPGASALLSLPLLRYWIFLVGYWIFAVYPPP